MGLMNRQEVLLTIEKALSEVLERPIDGLKEETALFDELRLDSSARAGAADDRRGGDRDLRSTRTSSTSTTCGPCGSLLGRAYVEAALRKEEGTP